MSLTSQKLFIAAHPDLYGSGDRRDWIAVENHYAGIEQVLNHG
jgi:dTDP-D-glucose 4,6-dehydratase